MVKRFGYGKIKEAREVPSSWSNAAVCSKLTYSKVNISVL
jgi:hypothetical protein